MSEEDDAQYETPGSVARAWLLGLGIAGLVIGAIIAWTGWGLVTDAQSIGTEPVYVQFFIGLGLVGLGVVLLILRLVTSAVQR